MTTGLASWCAREDSNLRHTVWAAAKRVGHLSESCEGLSEDESIPSDGPPRFALNLDPPCGGLVAGLSGRSGRGAPVQHRQDA